jgi:four helix bundle protein
LLRVARSWTEEEESKRISSYRDLRIYQRSYEAALETHKITLRFPGFERSELGSQLRRAATSIPINIAEGYGRKRSPEDFKRFLVIALGSCDEVSVLLDFVHDLKYLGDEIFAIFAKWKAEYVEIGKGINKLIQVWR